MEQRCSQQGTCLACLCLRAGGECRTGEKRRWGQRCNGGWGWARHSLSAIERTLDFTEWEHGPCRGLSKKANLDIKVGLWLLCVKKYEGSVSKLTGSPAPAGRCETPGHTERTLFLTADSAAWASCSHLLPCPRFQPQQRKDAIAVSWAELGNIVGGTRLVGKSRSSGHDGSESQTVEAVARVHGSDLSAQSHGDGSLPKSHDGRNTCLVRREGATPTT